MSERRIKLPICTSCKKIVTPGEDATKFQCPECGDIIIWRCSKCRVFRRQYKCPKCRFTGP